MESARKYKKKTKLNGHAKRRGFYVVFFFCYSIKSQNISTARWIWCFVLFSCFIWLKFFKSHRHSHRAICYGWSFNMIEILRFKKCICLLSHSRFFIRFCLFILLVFYSIFPYNFGVFFSVFFIVYGFCLYMLFITGKRTDWLVLYVDLCWM